MIKNNIVKISDKTEFKIRGSIELKKDTFVPNAVKMVKINKKIINDHLNLLKVPTKKITPFKCNLNSSTIYSFWSIFLKYGNLGFDLN